MVVHDAPQRQQITRSRARSARPAQLGPIGTARRRGGRRGDRGRDGDRRSPGQLHRNPPRHRGRHEPDRDCARVQAPRPEFYLTVTYPASGQNVLQFQVRRTTGGAVTSSKTIPAGGVGWGGYLASAAGDRTFYFARVPVHHQRGPAHHVRSDHDHQLGPDQRLRAGRPVCSGHGHRLRGLAGRIAGRLQRAARRLRGRTAKAFRQERARSASRICPPEPSGPGRTRAAQVAVGRLSWTPDGRTLIVDEAPRGLGRVDLTVFALNPSASGGGSLQAHSTTLLRQNGSCSTCVRDGARGPGRQPDRARGPRGPGSGPACWSSAPRGGPGVLERSCTPDRAVRQATPPTTSTSSPTHQGSGRCCGPGAHLARETAHSFRRAGSPVAACTRSPGSGGYSRKASPGKRPAQHQPAKSVVAEAQSPTLVAADRIPISVSTAS